MNDTPAFEPRTGDFTRMLVLAGHLRRERRTRLAVAAVPVVTGVLLLNAAGPAPGGGAGLEPTGGSSVASAPAGPRAPRTPAAPVTTAGRAAGPAKPAAAAPAARGTAAHHEPSPDPGTERTHRPDGYVVDTPDARPTYRFHDDPATYAYVPGAAPEQCRTEGATPNSGSSVDPGYYKNRELAKDFCQSLTAPDSVAAGDEVTLVYRVCRSGAVGVAAQTLSRSDHPDAPWFYATWTNAASGRGAHWTGETPPAAAQVTVHPGDCAQWTYRFAAMREGYEDGPMAPGRYVLSHNFGAPEFYFRCRTPGPGCAVREIEVTKK